MKLLATFLLVLIATAAPAHADPITAAITGFIANASATTLFFVRIGLSLGLSALATALRGSPDRPRSPGIKTESTTTGGSNPETFILGRYATAGNMVAPPYSHPNTGGVPNEFLTYVIDVSGAPGVSLQRVIVAGEYVSDLQSSAGDHDFEGMLEDVPGVGLDVPHFYITFHDGTQTAADAYMMANYASYPERPWSSDMIGEGIAYAVVTFRYNRAVFNNLPGVRMEIDGIPLYDPRKDTTVGGSGSHRWATPSTWEQTDNPAVMIYNILRGIALPGGKTWGGNVAAADLPLANWFAAMNECDVAIDLDGGGTEPQYRAGIEVSVDEAPAAVIEELLKSCSAEIVEFGGVYKIRVGPPAMPVYTFSDDDISVDVAQSLTPYPGLDGVHNAIHATHPAPEALWESRDAPPLYNSTWEAEDGGRQLVADVSLPAVPYEVQVQRLMKAWINDERRFRRHNLTLPPEASILEPLDTVGWTSPRNGYTAKVFEVTEVSDDLKTLAQTIAIRERDSDDFDWSTADQIAVTHPSTTYITPSLRTVPGFLVEADSIRDGGNAQRRPAIKLSWTTSAVREKDVLRWQVQIEGISTVATGTVEDPTDPGFVRISEGILPGTTYRARARLRASNGSVWTAWQTVTTGDFRFGEDDLPDNVNQTVVDFAALTDGFAGTLADLEVDAAAAQQAALDAAASALDAAADALASDAAKTAAQLARDNAQASATSASGSASSAAGSASAASASESAAGSSASAADASRLAAESATVVSIPGLATDFREDGKYWTDGISGAPFSTPLSGWSFETVAGEGRAAYVVPYGGYIYLMTQGVFRGEAGRTYRLTARVEVGTTVSGSNDFAMWMRGLDENYDFNAVYGITWRTATTDPATYSVEITLPADVPYIRAGLYTSNIMDGPGRFYVYSFKVEDVTESKAAEGFSSSAEIARDAAVISETNAAGSAATATTQANLAASSANAAGASASDAAASETAAATSASNASGSASTATTQANLAASSAFAANNSASDAAASESNAASSETNAATSESNAAGSAASAVSARDLAVQARDAAQVAEGNASSSASAAASSAAAASASASGASSSATASETSRLAAEAATVSSIGTLVSTFEEDGKYWTNDLSGAPFENDLTGWDFLTVSGEGRCAKADADGALDYLMTAGTIRGVAGRTYRITARVDLNGTISGTPHFSIFFRALDADYVYDGTAPGFTNYTATSSFADYAMEVTLATDIPHMRAGLYKRADITGGGAFRVAFIKVEDITDSAAAIEARAAAEIAESAAVSAKTDAEAASAAAAFSRDVSVAVSGGGEVANPFFLEPEASPTATPSGFGIATGGGSSMSRVATGNKYGNGPCIEYDTGATLNEGRPLLSHDTTSQGGLLASDVVAVEVDFEVEMISGSWGSAAIHVNWWGSSYSTQEIKLADAITSRNGKIQRLTALVERPASFVAGGSNLMRVLYYGNLNTAEDTEHQARIHRFDYRLVSATASALLSQQAVADLEGNALASFVMRAKAGAALGTVEVIAATDAANGGASASKIIMTADEIELAGDATIFSGNEIKSSNFSTGVSGWRIKNGGDAEFNNIIDRSDIVDGAVSDGAYDADTTSRIVGSDSDLQMAVVALGPVDYDQYWKIGFVGEHRGDGGGVRSSQFIWRQRTKTSGVWGAWTTLTASSGNGSDVWEQKFYFLDFIGKFDDVEFEIQASVNAPAAQWTQNNIRRTHLIARSNPVK